MAIETRIETLPAAVLLCIFRSRSRPLSLNVQSCVSVWIHARSTWRYTALSVMCWVRGWHVRVRVAVFESGAVRACMPSKEERRAERGRLTASTLRMCLHVETRGDRAVCARVCVVADEKKSGRFVCLRCLHAYACLRGTGVCVCVVPCACVWVCFSVGLGLWSVCA